MKSNRKALIITLLCIIAVVGLTVFRAKQTRVVRLIDPTESTQSGVLSSEQTPVSNELTSSSETQSRTVPSSVTPSVPENTTAAEPWTEVASGGFVLTSYEPVYGVNISSEGIKQPITLEYAVPERFRPLYNEILAQLRQFNPTIKLSSPISDDAVKHVVIYLRDLNPELFFVDWTSYNYMSNGARTSEIRFKFICDNIPAKQEELNSVINAIVAKANKLPNLFERELYVHDYLVNNVSYSTQAENNGSAYGALVGGFARCEGYSRAFQIIMLRLGVPVFNVIGVVDNGNHMWNAIDLYGKYYYVDVTFDDDAAEQNKTAYSEYQIHHSCFNIPAELLTRSHYINPVGALDRYGSYQNLLSFECNSYDYFYYKIRGLWINNFEQFKYVLERNANKKHVAVYFDGNMPSSADFCNVFRDYYDSRHIFASYKLNYSSEESPIYCRNVFEISWENR